MQTCCPAEWCWGSPWGLWEQPQAGCSGEPIPAVCCLRGVDTCTRFAGRLAWLADRVGRKSRCCRDNPSWKKLSLSPMKLLCVQLPVMYFAVQGLSRPSFTFVLTHLYLEVCNVSTDLDLKHHRIVQLEMIWVFFTCLSLPFLFPVFSGNSCEDKDITLDHKANDHFEHWTSALPYYFNQLLIADKVV